MVFLSGVVIAMLMYYGNKDFLVHALCVALVVELVNITIINNLLKSKEKKLSSGHAESSEKMKKMLWSYQEKEEELKKKDLLQREEIAVLKKSLDQHVQKLDLSQRKVKELQEQMRKAAEPPPKADRLTKEDLSLY